jgi:hypothetical protein
MSAIAPTPPGIAQAVAYVNGSDQRYRALVHVLVTIMDGVKVHREEKQDALSDVSDMLDGLVPSPRSGFIAKKK